MNGCQESSRPRGRARQHAGSVRSPEFGCDVVEVVLSFALSLGDVTRF